MKIQILGCVVASVVTVSLAAFSAQGAELSPGGEASICDYPHSVTQMDLFENGNNPQLGDASLNYQDKVKLAIDRIDARDGDFATLLRTGLRNFRVGSLPASPAEFRTLTTIHSCDVVPVDQSVWKEMNADNKAATALHEIIFSAAKLNANSEALSRLVDLLVTNQIETMSFNDYASAMIAANITDKIQTSVGNYVIESDLNKVVNRSGTVCGDYVKGDTTILVAGEEADLSADKSKRSNLCFYSGGQLAYVKALNPADVANDGSSLVYATPKNYSFEISGKSVRFSIESGISLYPNGSIRAGVILDDFDGISAGTKIHVSQNGTVTK